MDNLIQRIEVITELVKKDLRSYYGDKILGYLWLFLQPLILALLIVYVRHVFKHKFAVQGLDFITMYAILVSWRFFTISLQKSSSSIKQHYQFVTNFGLPIILFPLSIVISCFFISFVNVIVFFFLMIFIKKILFFNAILLILVLAIAGLFVTALCLIFSMLECFIPDIKFIVPFISRISLFLLPVFFSVNIVPESIKTQYVNFPLVWLVAKTEDIVTGSHYVPETAVFNVLFAGVVALFFAYVFFKRFEGVVIEKAWIKG